MIKYVFILLLVACGQAPKQNKEVDDKVNQLNVQADYYKKSSEYFNLAAQYYNNKKASDSLNALGEYYKAQGDSMKKLTSQ